MKLLPYIFLLLLTTSFAVAEPRSREKGLFEFRDGDRVVFLGSGFIERLQNTGYLETMLTAAMPSKNITFRNLGWSGDTVWGDARALFGGRADGFKRLLGDVALCKPTVLIVCYGENEAYAGEAGLDEFRRGLGTLLDSLEATGARIVFLGPARHESLDRLKLDQTAYNRDLRKYNDVSEAVCRERRHVFIDLFDYLDDYKASGFLPFTSDGMHFQEHGYFSITNGLIAPLGERFESYATCAVEIDARNSSYSATGTCLDELTITENGIAFSATDRTTFRGVDLSGQNPELLPKFSLRVKSLPGRSYAMRIDGKAVAVPITMALPDLREETLIATALSSDELAKGIQCPNPLIAHRGQKLRDLVVQKDELFFHRYRPQNETYLFLFRKHEQGNNAAEIPQFDPLIAELEKKIAVLKQPVKQKYELIKVK